MLCDMRDLAQCALVKKAWSEAAAMLLYVKVQISNTFDDADGSSALGITVFA